MNNLKGKLPDFDTLTDHLIRLIEYAGKTTQVEAENNTLKNKNAALHNQLRILEERYQKKEDQAMRYKVAVQQGEFKNL